MRVAFIEQESQMGGVEMTTLVTASGLDPSRFAVTVVCPEEGELVERLRQNGVRCEIIPRPKFYSVSSRVGKMLLANPFSILATGVSVWRAAARLTDFMIEHADVVVTKGLLAHFYGGLAAKRARVPIIWHVQEVANARSLAGLYLNVLNRVARRWPREIIVDAQAVGQQFDRSLHEAGRIHLLYNGIDTRSVR